MGHMFLNRKIFTDNSTIGKLIFGGFECFTLEDTMRRRDINEDGKLQSSEKVPGRTAIPAGIYDISIQESGKFDRPMPFLMNVPLFEGIMIHPGNIPENTNGCILIGMTHPNIDFVGESKKAFDLLFPQIEEILKISPLKIHISGGYKGEL